MMLFRSVRIAYCGALCAYATDRPYWELRHNFTAYDATYIPLAEATDSVLYTYDEKNAR
jgi:predicted nucleic acid-binding protein